MIRNELAEAVSHLARIIAKPGIVAKLVTYVKIRKAYRARISSDWLNYKCG
jgi:hypothetical protein